MIITFERTRAEVPDLVRAPRATALRIGAVILVRPTAAGAVVSEEPAATPAPREMSGDKWEGA